ncbi:MAG TPA: MMPL family transporter [Mycobacteriales bacterium]|nr:MMPL family transporter [Mycobacteriales bacterium]
MERLYAVLTGRRTAWAVLALAVLASALVLAFRGTAPSDNDPTGDLPAAAESTRVAELQRQLPSGQTNPALVVYSRDGRPLTAADEAAIRADAAALREVALGGQLPPPVFAPDRRAALVSVPLPATSSGEDVAAAVDRIRAEARAGLPGGLTAQVTGGAGFLADISAAFDGADVSLLGVTVAVVALLLLVTYRSPWLWLVPLTVIAVGDQVALGVITILARTAGLPTNDASGGIASILVFGAGTNYALLLIARYREELRQVEDRRDAMRRALRAAAPAIAASAATVALSLLTLGFAELGFNRSVGLSGAVGIAVALVFALAVLPAALVLFGRRLFWPFVPRVGQPEPTRTGVWARVGAAVTRRPVAVAACSLAVLALLAIGASGVRIGLSQTEQFRVRAESVDGQQTLARYFPAGAGEPVAILTTPADAEQVRAAAAGTPGVASARLGERAGDVVQVDAVLADPPGTPGSDAAVRDLRGRLDSAGGGSALVGGAVAIDLDTRDAAGRDRRVIVPLVLGVVLVVLGLLLRSLVAPVVLVATVVASFFSALGAGWLVSDRLLDYPALDLSVPLLSFLFLVALGVDYNIFLTTRAREEAARRGTRSGVVVALAATGGVITSAGVLLAAVFTVLGVLPVVLLTQIGVIVALGVLLDTLLVRSVLVPALATRLGRRFWWPSRLSRWEAAGTGGADGEVRGDVRPGRDVPRGAAV